MSSTKQGESVARLHQVFQGILNLLHPAKGKGEVLPGFSQNAERQLMEKIEEGLQLLADNIRQELPIWLDAAAHLEKLSECKYLSVPANMLALKEELTQARSQATQVLEGLDALRQGVPSPVANAPREQRGLSPPVPHRKPDDLPASAPPRKPATTFLAPARPKPADEEPPSPEITTTLPSPQPPHAPFTQPRPPATKTVAPLSHTKIKHATPTPAENAAPSSQTKTNHAAPAPAGNAASSSQTNTEHATPTLAETPLPPSQTKTKKPHYVPVEIMPPPTAVPAEARPRPMPSQDSGQIRLQCPECDASGIIRWDRLGQVLVCKACARLFRIHTDGRLTEVAQDTNGRWVEKNRLSKARGTRQSWQRRVSRMAPLVCLLILFFLGAMAWERSNRQAPPPELPNDLEPRAEMLTRAWLKRDLLFMRRLTATTHDRILNSWYVHHPPPMLQEGVSSADVADALAIEVRVVNKQANTANLIVKGRVGSGKPIELAQQWQERGDAWYFLPTAR